MTDSLTPEDLARSLRDLYAWAMANAPVEESGLRAQLREHLGCDPAELPVVSREISPWERANLQVALDAYLAEGGRTHEYVGLAAQHGWHIGLAELAQTPHRGGYTAFVGRGGPKEHVTVQVGERTIVCVTAGLFLIGTQGRSLAAVAR